MNIKGIIPFVKVFSLLAVLGGHGASLASTNNDEQANQFSKGELEPLRAIDIGGQN